MGENWVCPRCGNHTQHFSVVREQYMCDACGFVIQNENDKLRKEQYSRSIRQAKKHLQVGNWDSCRSIVRPMLNEYPTDSLLYLLLLAALTKGYDDYLLEGNVERRLEAANVFDKLERLNSVNQTMRRYADARIQVRRNMLSSRVNRSAVLIIMIIVGYLVAVSLSSWMIFIVVSVIGYYTVKRIIEQIRPVSAMKELSQLDESNPFR